jgi:hypothetical protein
MDKDSLQRQLAELKAQIAAARSSGNSGPAPDAVAEIQRLIDASENTPHPSLPDRLEEIAVQFEAEHPTLAASARRLIDLLGEVGI